MLDLRCSTKPILQKLQFIWSERENIWNLAWENGSQIILVAIAIGLYYLHKLNNSNKTWATEKCNGDENTQTKPCHIMQNKSIANLFGEQKNSGAQVGNRAVLIP